MMPSDVRFALRALGRSPGYVAVALTTLVLGIGANTAVFSLVRGILLAPLPFAQPDRLVHVREVSMVGREMQAAWRNFADWRTSATSFEALVAHYPGAESTVLGAGEPLRAGTVGVSEGFLRALGVQPALGRGFAAEDHRAGAAPAVVVSDDFWRTRLGGERDLSVVTLNAEGLRLHVVGVMPPSFRYPAGIDLWHPLELDELSDSRTAHNFVVIGRLAAGASLAQADAELDAITRRFRSDAAGAAEARQSPEYFPESASVRPLAEALVGETRRPLLVLLGAALLVLLLACTNLASTTLARATARKKDYALRHALGARRMRIVRGIVVEALVLGVGGAALGLVLGALVVRVLPLLAPAALPRLDEVRLDAPVVAFACGLALLTATLAGLVPGVRIARGAAASLHAGGRASEGPAGQRVWKVLVACEMALALVLLVGSGLLLRSFAAILDVQPGFRTHGVLLATVNPPSLEYETPERKRAYYDALLTELEAVRGVEAAGLIAQPPLAWTSNGLVDVEDGAVADVTADYQLLSAGYLDALDIPLVRGRNFDPTDGPDAPHVVLVNEALARQAWPGEDPIGKRITGGGMDNFWAERTWATVIGVVPDVRQRELSRAPEPTLYFSYRQRPFRAWAMTAAVRPRAGEASALAGPVRDAVRRVDANVPVRVATIEERVSRSLAPRRFILLLIGSFAALALVLGIVGVYGVVGYAVQRRRREIGIRMALGARPGVVRRQMQREYLIASGAGAAAGVVLALLLTRSLEALLFEVEPTDPATFAGGLALLGLASWAASFVPSLRGTRLDPRETMQAD
jgi:predicted permease